ncbi:FRG domain-containing protein [Bacteroidota bacterium]
MKSPNDIVVNSWTELIKELYANSWTQEIQRFRSNFAFRGLSDKNYDLKTSLLRLGVANYKLEYHIIRNFKKYAPGIPGKSSFTIWNWLVIAQHHRLPTRLLDWTFSPFIALHFATSNLEKYTMDGAIWCVDFVKLHTLLPAPLREVLDEEGAYGFTVEMLSRFMPDTLNEFDRLSNEDFALFFNPPSINDRIVNQFALHSVVSNSGTKLDEILMKHPYLYKRVIIPTTLKWEIRDKLDQANINERILFPGLEGLCKWLKRHYSPKV